MKDIKDVISKTKDIFDEKKNDRKIKKFIIKSFMKGKLDKGAIKALRLLNHQNRAKLSNKERDELDKKITDKELYNKKVKDLL